MSGPTADGDTSYDIVEQYVNWGGHTVTVDPVDRQPWIHEGGDMKHLDAVRHARMRRENVFTDTFGLVRQMHPPKAHVQTFLPTTSDLLQQGYVKRPGRVAWTENGAVAPFDQVYSYRNGVINDSRPTMRPVIDQLHRDGTFAATWHDVDVDRATRGARAEVSRRVFER